MFSKVFLPALIAAAATAAAAALPARAQTAPRPVQAAPPAGKTIPMPSVARINYAKPQEYVALSPSFGDKARIEKIAAGLKADTPEKSLLAIGQWIEANVRYDPGAAYQWRSCDTILDSKVYGGCADHAVLFAALARACGIPAVFVKTMDADWIREFQSDPNPSSWRGHVFLEVFLDDRWRLLDAQGLQIYDDYDPGMRILPGLRYAYDKGADPQALLLSLDWERWKQQTAAYFRNFDVTRLPVGPGRSVDSAHDVYIAANSPIYEAVAQRCQALGATVRMSFNNDFEKWLARAKGSSLIITSVGDSPVLPREYHAQYLPVSLEELKRKVQTDGRGVVRKQLTDGTRVILVYGKDVDAILSEIQTLTLGSTPEPAR